MILNEREKRTNEMDKTYKQKEKDLEDIQKLIDEATKTLQEKEDDITFRLSKLAMREKEYNGLLNNLEIKEKELLVKEETLKEREQVEIQKILDEHNHNLDAKKHEFELEVEQKRKAVDEELEQRAFELKKKEAEIGHREEKLAKKEQTLEKKSEKLRGMEENFQSKQKDLKEQEKLLRTREKNLEDERKQLLVEKEELVDYKSGLEKIRSTNEEQLLKIREEKDQLRVTEEERSEHLRLQTELRQELENCRVQKEKILMDAEDLKQLRETFEKEWEELDEKRAEVEKELKDLFQSREKFEKLKEAEQERLQKKKLELEEEIKREFENLNFAKETSAARLEHEKSVLEEQIQTERSQMLRDFELKKKELESDMQSKLEERESDLCNKKKIFEDEKERELGNINSLRELARREMEEMKQERLLMEKEKDEFFSNKKHLEEEQVGIQKDIDQLMLLSQKLKEQRDKLTNESERFISFVEKQGGCSNCGEFTREFVLKDMQYLSEMENLEIPDTKFSVDDKKRVNRDVEASEGQKADALPDVGSITPVSAGTMSWLRKCTSKIFNLSPSKKGEVHHVSDVEQSKASEDGSLAVNHVNDVDQSKASGGNDLDEVSHAAASPVDVLGLPSGQDISVEEQSNINSKDAEDSHPSDLRSGKRKVQKRRRPKINRTRTMKGVVKEAGAILGLDLERHENEQQNGNAEDSSHTNLDSREETGVAERGRRGNGRKRNRITNDVGENEGYSDSVNENQQRRRRHKPAGAVEQSLGQPRYNFRRTKGRSTVAAPGDSRDQNEDRVNEVGGGDRQQTDHALSVTIASGNGGSAHLVQCGSEANMEDTTKELAPQTTLSEEVNGTPERVWDISNGNDGNDVEGKEDDGEYEHPGEVSMGKKLWTFFTT
ncbi:hypothetical protein SAY86_003248 [Trapa natans]|uniref:Nuclear matrix constituent protein 1-like protein n=1 Tax=Trapa natans TaxID=22666 RepID=A0AAN7RML1_TRANT|nr:hypothetical protein SAY86_003248 [Trapa natans]